ncbi:MAG: HD domain-containing protein [Ruminococcaceae bacterium]|nr:HD domain-containing protein [Oscillospiraceae bacterium]
MEYHAAIQKMTAGKKVEGFYVLSEAASKTTAAGKPFLSAAISDRTGRLPAMVWDYSGPLSAADAGKIVKVRGEVSEYRGALQITVERIRLAAAGDRYDLSALVPAAPIDPDAALREVRGMVASIGDADYRRIAETLLERNLDAFQSIPAAKSVHHAFLHGLLMHTLNMLKTADFLSGLYGNVIDRSLMLAGTLLHDFKKREEFLFSELGLVTEYSVKGQLLGHLVMGAQEIAAVADELGLPEEKSVLLQHMALSHHGEPEWGAAVRPMCAEAELLAYVDLIDSRMEIYRENIEATPAGAFSDRIFALDGKRIYHHN